MLASQLGRLKLAVRSRRFWIYVAVTIAGIGVGVGIALAGGGGGSKKPSAPALASAFPVAQKATASASNLTVRLTSALFSGTETRVAFTVTPPRGEASQVRNVGITRNAVEYSWRAADTAQAAQASPAVALADVRTDIDSTPVASPEGSWSFVLDLGPVTGQGGYSITISRMQLSLTGGTSRIVTGPWKVAVAVPINVASSLTTETLKPGPPATADGIVVTVRSAVRSNSETLIQIQSSGVFGAVFLASPTLNVSGKAYTGTLLSFTGGTTMIYDFPAIPRGVPATLAIRNAVTPAAGETAYSAYVDIGRAMLRAGLAGKAGDNVALASDGVIASPGGPVASGIEFQTATSVVVTLAQPLFLGQTGVSAPVEMTLPDGSTVHSEPSTEAGSTNSAAQGVSRLTFQVTAAELDGVVRLSLGPVPTVRGGPWTVQLGP